VNRIDHICVWGFDSSIMLGVLALPTGEAMTGQGLRATAAHCLALAMVVGWAMFGTTQTLAPVEGV
jgi:hypothetical protein